MRKPILTALLLFASGTALAAPLWAAVADSNNGKLKAYVDLGSIRINGTTRSALFKYIYATHSEKNERANKWYKVSFGQETFDCANETSRMDALRVRYEDGTEWNERQDQLPTAWTLIGPRTLRDFQRHFICRGVPK
jgi:hypothetical protein